MLFRKTIYILVLAAISMTASTAFAKRQQAKAFTIVIDAGHGGNDAGAVDNNVKEKDINLGVAKALAEKIRKGMKNVKVIMTRDNDTFVSLQQRADKANGSKADLFISIHTNSVDASNKNRRNVSGASVYALGLHKDANNMAVARRENAVIELEKNFDQKYKGFDPNSDESYIIFEMAQKKNLSQSIKFADEVQKQLVKTAGRRDRGVHQAGFWVLWATSMPAVLVELDFICNPNSAKFMASEKGENKLAESIFNAVKNYRNNLAKATAYSGQVEAPDEIPAFVADGEAVLLSVDELPDRKVIEAPAADYAKSTGYAPAKRRRRSLAAKEASDKRVLETASITVKTHTHTTRQVAKEPTKPSVADDIKTTEAPKGNQNAADTKNQQKGKNTQKINHDKKQTSTRVYNNKVISINKSSSASKTTEKRGKTKTEPSVKKVSGSKSGSENHLNRPSLRKKRK